VQPLGAEGEIVVGMSFLDRDDLRKTLEDWLATSPTALDEALDEVAASLGSNPAKARQGAIAIYEIAIARHRLADAARATYLQAQIYAVDAQFAAALQFIEKAHQLYLSAHLEIDALRTNIGRIHVLKELGQYQAAQDTAIGILSTLATSPITVDPEIIHTRKLIAAMAHQNLGVCLEQIGQYEEALQAYALAETQYRELEQAEHIGDILNNTGVVLLKLGRSEQALHAFESATQAFATHGASVKQALALANRGNVHIQRGNYILGLADLEHANATLADMAVAADRQSVLLDIAETYLSLNLYSEAQLAFEQVLNLAQQSEMAHEQARTLWGLSIALTGLQQYHAALRAIEQSAVRFRAAGNVPILCEVMLQHSRISERYRDLRLAQTQAESAYAFVAAGKWPLQQLQALLRLAELALQGSEATAAIIFLQKAESIQAGLDLPNIQVQLDHLWGRAALSRNDVAEARNKLAQALQKLEARRVYLQRADWRSTFLVDKSALYADWLQLLMQHERDTAVIFNAVEQAKSRALLDLIAGVAKPHTAQETTSPVLQKIAALQTRWSQIYDDLMSAQNIVDPSADFAALQAEALAVERAIHQLQLQVEANAQTVDAVGAPFELDKVQAALDTNTVMLSYCIDQNSIAAFVLTRDSVQCFKQICTVNEAQLANERLAVEWQRFDAGAAFVGRHLQQLTLSAREALHTLYRALIAPLLPALGPKHAQQATKLVIVPHGFLHHIPFHALFDGDDFLVDWCEISYAPSASVFALSQQRTSPANGSQAIFGVADELIPLVDEEVRAIGAVLPDSQIYLNEAATLKSVSKEAAGCALLHLACHGQYRADNPLFSALKLHDGWLHAYTLQTYSLHGATVVLSACESARGTIVANDDVLGLTRAILGAGAATLVASLWLAADQSTTFLIKTWYAQMQKGLSNAAALRQAQLETKAQFPHPFYWASFVLIGRRV